MLLADLNDFAWVIRSLHPLIRHVIATMIYVTDVCQVREKITADGFLAYGIRQSRIDSRNGDREGDDVGGWGGGRRRRRQ